MLALGGVTASGNEVAAVTGYAFYPGVTDFANARILDLPTAADLHIDLVMTPKPRTFTILGKLIDSRTGQPPPRASVILWTDTPGAVLSAEDGLGPEPFYDAATGTIQIRDVLPGTYTLAALVQDTAPTRQNPPVHAVATLPVTVAAADVEGLVLSVVPTGSIPGRLRLEGQFPAGVTVERLSVLLQPTSALQQELQRRIAGFYRGSPVSADGTFLLDNVVPGDYRIEILQLQSRMPFGPNDFLKEGRFEAVDVLSSPLRFSNTSAGMLEVVIAAAGGKVSGTVHDMRSQPVPHAQIVIVPDGARHRPELYRRGTADESGQFTIPAVAPGDYRVFSWESLEEYAWFDPELLAHHQTRGAHVRVSESSTSSVSVRIIPTEGTQ
jgi:hypothetical protein